MLATRTFTGGLCLRNGQVPEATGGGPSSSETDCVSPICDKGIAKFLVCAMCALAGSSSGNGPANESWDTGEGDRGRAGGGMRREGSVETRSTGFGSSEVRREGESRDNALSFVSGD